MQTLSPQAAIPAENQMIAQNMPEATDDLINHLLSEIEELYFDTFDEVSDKKMTGLTYEVQSRLMARLEMFVEMEPDFDSIA